MRRALVKKFCVLFLVGLTVLFGLCQWQKSAPLDGGRLQGLVLTYPLHLITAILPRLRRHPCRARACIGLTNILVRRGRWL